MSFYVILNSDFFIFCAEFCIHDFSANQNSEYPYSLATRNDDNPFQVPLPFVDDCRQRAFFGGAYIGFVYLSLQSVQACGWPALRKHTARTKTDVQILRCLTFLRWKTLLYGNRLVSLSKSPLLLHTKKNRSCPLGRLIRECCCR